jgi:hypothetical protein
MAARSTNLNLRIDPAIREALKIAALRDHRSVSNMIEYIVVQYCQKNEIPIPKQEKLEDSSAS